MAFTDVVNTTGKVFQQYPELISYLGNTSGAAPPSTSPTAFTGVHATRVVQSASGSRLDFADLTYHLTASLENRSQPASFSRMVAVHLPDTLETKLHLGDLVTETAAVNKSAESLTTQSQLRPYHFGDPVKGYRVWNVVSGLFENIEDDIVFNPVVDDITKGNRSDKFIVGYVWTHPEIADSVAGEEFNDQERKEWTLDEAVEAICWHLNPNETHIDNPVFFTELNTAPEIRDLRIKIGQRLPDALDHMLLPLGYNWFIDYDTFGNPRITLFEIGVGDEKELKFQAAGSVLDLELSNVNQFETTNSIGDAFNEVLALGEFEEAELTIPLYAGWPAAGDNLNPSDLAKDGVSYIGNESAWRLFIANEAGDLDPSTSRIGQMPAVPDFTTVFETAVPHRRVLGEPLTYLAGDGPDRAGATPVELPQRRPVYLEWSDDAGKTWQLEDPTWTIKLCPDQIGILFDGKEVPTELIDAGDDLRVRITGTVFGDSRLRGFAARQTHAANGRTFRQVLDVPEKFQSRWRQPIGTYRSVLIDTGHDADARDDYDAILAYAENIRDKNECAELNCEFRLPGWHTEYKIGDLITKIAGREISLDAASATAPDNRYVQIVERIFEMGDGGPSTVLIVDRGIST